VGSEGGRTVVSGPDVRTGKGGDRTNGRGDRGIKLLFCTWLSLGERLLIDDNTNSAFSLFFLLCDTGFPSSGLLRVGGDDAGVTFSIESFSSFRITFAL
jgi:hypothetical protein